MSVALIVGHTHKRKGAQNYKGEYEYDFNRRVALKVYELLEGRIDVLFKGLYDPYEAILEDVGHDLVIELHFNYFGGRVTGCEALIIDTYSEQSANNLLHLISSFFNLRNRGVKLIGPSNRGYSNLKTISKYSKKYFILEPCFQLDKAIFENEDEYALLLADFLENYIAKPLQEEKSWKKLLASLWALLPYSRDNSKVKIPYTE